MTTPLPGSRSEEPDETRVVTLRRQLLVARREVADLRTQLDEACKDRERLDWYEEQHTLHGAVESLYVVNGYVVNVTHDGKPTGEHWGETLRAAIDQARGA